MSDRLIHPIGTHPPSACSVTTNGLGTPAGALAAARAAVEEISHYPPADFEPALSHLAEFLWPGGECLLWCSV